MIIVMKPNAPVEERDRIINRLQERGYKVDISAGNQRTILGIIGDTSVLNPHDLMVNDWIDWGVFPQRRQAGSETYLLV